MTKREYADYVASVEAFYDREGLNCLTTISQEEGLTEPFFSWRRCDCCGRSQGGDRYDCNGYNPTTKEVQDGYSVCPDCVYFTEYGRLDDQTMDSIEKDNGEDNGLSGSWDNPPEQNWRS